MSEEYQKYLLGPDGYLAQLSNHLEKKGWLKNFIFEVWHEAQCAEGFDGWKEASMLAKRVREIAPGLPLAMRGCCPAGGSIPDVLRDLDYCGVYLAAFTSEGFG